MIFFLVFNKNYKILYSWFWNKNIFVYSGDSSGFFKSIPVRGCVWISFVHSTSEIRMKLRNLLHKSSLMTQNSKFSNCAHLRTLAWFKKNVLASGLSYSAGNFGFICVDARCSWTRALFYTVYFIKIPVLRLINKTENYPVSMPSPICFGISIRE